LITDVIPFKPAIIHWAIIGMSLLMVGLILIYAIFENFGPFYRSHQLLKEKLPDRAVFWLTRELLVLFTV